MWYDAKRGEAKEQTEIMVSVGLCRYDNIVICVKDYKKTQP